MEQREVEGFHVKVRRFYGRPLQALRRKYKKSGKANDAHFVFDYLKKEIEASQGNRITSIPLTNQSPDIVGDTADAAYVSERFVRDVIADCLELGLLEDNGLGAITLGVPKQD